jgi:hypothetical protein
MENKKPLPVSFKFALLLFFISLQCFLGALYLKERESYYKLESELSSPPKKSYEAAAENQQISVKSEEPATIHEALVETVQPFRAVSSIAEDMGQETMASTKYTPLFQKASLPEPSSIKKSGTLWFDKQNDNYVITIGRRNGIEEGVTLNIYDSDEIIGKVRVIRPMEKLSIVEIGETDRQRLTRTYYKVSFE